MWRSGLSLSQFNILRKYVVVELNVWYEIGGKGFTAVITHNNKNCGMLETDMTGCLYDSME